MNFLCKIVVPVVWIFIASSSAPAADHPLTVGNPLPGFMLAAPTDKAHRTYMGLTDQSPFTISQIKARVVIIQIFSMY